ncbi:MULTISPECIES: hypothetical protein [Azospirillum]|uniref:Uncharacterized protein n=1 Tax=Azospirillum brasilense TaxID=192 RepID=A0ABU4P823_AZOBR|nr:MULTISPECIES: hypothetical protein [Azospirillum]MBY3753774.1 hypothetical protein [Azospirillum formosense]MDW7554048.1 hypothetical protein [Azospirillum brasilense]MDW7592985.1 hypothetical protein [Azospirillum brasilense]MDW7593693.1 hypothetical protein [Azospirillum brasilense]MDW7627064.1 hypothetical protein [Azospirillum brasilense]
MPDLLGVALQPLRQSVHAAVAGGRRALRRLTAEGFQFPRHGTVIGHVAS